MLHFYLLGIPHISRDGQPVVAITSQKSLALLYYLAYTQRPVSRLLLGSLLWPNKSDDEARVNLRQAVRQIRKVLPTALNATRATVAFNLDQTVRIDALAFSDTVSGDVGDMQQACDHYAGDFLAGFFVEEASGFEEWMLAERDRLRWQAIQALHSVGQYHLKRRNIQDGLPYTRKLLQLEPWREETHRQLMRFLAWDGQWAAALAQFEQCKRLLESELGVEPASETVALAERIKVLRQSVRSQLPAVTTSIIGRNQDIAELNQMLRESQGRIVTIVGPGGSGKSRLALAVGQAQAPLFLDGVFWIDLVDVLSAENLPTAIATQLNLSLTGQKDALTRLTDHLQTRESLLILDNFEQLLVESENVRIIHHLVQTCRNLGLLITSRGRLNLRQEWVYLLNTLEYPKENGPLENGAYAAVKLFEQAAQRENQRFQVAPVKVAVGKICQLVDGLPLGIELAAALTATHSCDEIALEIGRNYDAIQTTMFDVPNRQRSLRAVFSYSWALLQPDEQALLASLSIFRGGFTQAAAVAVAGATPSMLTTLQHRSLLNQLDEAGRFSLHEMVRVYAAEHLGAAQAIHKKHSDHYLDFVAKQKAALAQLSAKATIELLQRDFTNIRAAWETAWRSAQWQPIAQCVRALAQFCTQAGYARIGLRLFEGIIPALHNEEAQQKLLSRIYIEKARFLGLLGQQAQSIVVAKQALAVAENDAVLSADIYLLTGEALWHLGDYDLAREQLALALEHARSSPDLIREEIAGLRLFGNTWGVQGEYDQSLDYYDQAVVLARKHRLPIQEARILNNMGSIRFMTGEYEQARGYHEQTRAIHEQTGNQFGLGLSLGNLAECYKQDGDLVSAEIYYKKSLAIRQEIGDALGEGWVTHALGLLYQQHGKSAEAKANLEQSLLIRRRNNNKREIADSLLSLGAIAVSEGRFAAANAQFAEALELNQQLGNQFGLAYTYLNVAKLMRTQGKPNEAIVSLHDARAIFAQLQDKKGLAACDEFSAEFMTA